MWASKGEKHHSPKYLKVPKFVWTKTGNNAQARWTNLQSLLSTLDPSSRTPTWKQCGPWHFHGQIIEGTSAECGLRLHPGRGARRQGKKRGPTNVFFATKDWIYSANLGFYMMSLNCMQVNPGKCGVLQFHQPKKLSSTSSWRQVWAENSWECWGKYLHLCP